MDMPQNDGYENLDLGDDTSHKGVAVRLPGTDVAFDTFQKISIHRHTRKTVRQQ
jgi:hypothetical protein